MYFKIYISDTFYFDFFGQEGYLENRESFLVTCSEHKYSPRIDWPFSVKETQTS